MEEVKLPKEVEIDAKELDFDGRDEDEVIGDYLSDKYGFCHFGFKFEKDGDKIQVSDIEWDTSESLKETYTYSTAREHWGHQALDLVNEWLEDHAQAKADIIAYIKNKNIKNEGQLEGILSCFNFDGDTMSQLKDESLNEDANEPKLETFEEKIDFLVKDEDEAVAGYDKIIAMLGDDDANAIEQLNHIKEEEVAHKDFLEVLKGDKEAVYEHEDEEEHDESLKEDASRTRDDLRQEIQAKLDREGNTSDVRLKAERCGFKIVDGKVVEDEESKRRADAVTRPDFQKDLKEDAEDTEVEEHPIETTVEEVKEIASEVANKVVEPVSTEEEAEEQQEAIEDVVDEVVDDKFGEDDEDEDEDEMIVRDNDEVIDLDDIDDDFGFGEDLKEDTVKKDNKWVNKGKEGTHGEFKTKKEADAQRKAMFANGYHEEVEEDFDDDFGDSGDKFVPGEAEHFGITVDWDDLEDDVDEEDTKTFKKVIKSTDDKILDKHFGKGTPERKLVGAIKDIDEEAHETGHIKAKKPIELRARR